MIYKRACERSEINSLKSVMKFLTAFCFAIPFAVSFPENNSSVEDNKDNEEDLRLPHRNHHRQTGWPFEAVSLDHPIQSPIDLVTSKAVNKLLPELRIVENNVNGAPAKIINNGHTVEVSFEQDPELRPFLTGGPLGYKFYLEQMHFHWGDEDIWGSEHFVDGESFAVEIHLVHFNSKYKNFQEAAKHNDGLAVLAIFGETSAYDNPLLKPLGQLLPQITSPHMSATLDACLALRWPASALWTNYEYYTYPGSLTAAPYSENVVFILLPSPIKISHNQLGAFRSLQSEEPGNYITDNKRKLQPLHHRPIVRSSQRSG